MITESDACSKHPAQRIIGFTGLKFRLEKPGKSVSIGSSQCQREIHIVCGTRHTPGRDGKPADERILIQKMTGFRPVETTDNFA